MTSFVSLRLRFFDGRSCPNPSKSSASSSSATTRARISVLAGFCATSKKTADNARAALSQRSITS